MKKSLIALCLVAAFGAHAQTNVNSGSDSNSASGANSGSTSSIQGGSANSTAIGNQASSGSQSGSQSGANSGSTSGALGNSVTLNQNVPATQTVNSNVSGSTTSNNNTTVNGTQTQNVKYSGTVENRTTGGTVDTINQNVHYSGTQTVKNVPGIAMSGPASGPCTGVSGGLGVAGPGFGVGLNGSSVDDGCTVRENTRVLGQLFQSLDSADPAKASARAALLKSMGIIDAMNDKIAGKYIQPAPEPKKAEAPSAAPKVADVTALSVAQAGEPTDPFIRARMGLPKLK